MYTKTSKFVENWEDLNKVKFMKKKKENENKSVNKPLILKLQIQTNLHQTQQQIREEN